MAELKTKVNDGSVEDFIGSVENEKRRADGFVLLEIYKRATKQQPKLWGTSIVGFGMAQALLASVCTTTNLSAARKKVTGHLQLFRQESKT